MLPSQAKYAPGQQRLQSGAYYQSFGPATPFYNQGIGYVSYATPYANMQDQTAFKSANSMAVGSKYYPVYSVGPPASQPGQLIYKNVQFSNLNYQPGAFEPAPYPPYQITQDYYYQNYANYNAALPIYQRFIHYAERSRLYNDPVNGQYQVFLQPDADPQYYDQTYAYYPHIKPTPRPELSSAALNAYAYQVNLANADFYGPYAIPNAQDRFVPQISGERRPLADILDVKAHTYYEFLVFGQPKTESHEAIADLLAVRTGVRAEYVRTAPQGYIFYVEELNDLFYIYEKTPFFYNPQTLILIGVMKEPVHLDEPRQQYACVPTHYLLYVRYALLVLAAFVLTYCVSPLRTGPAVLHCAIALLIALLVLVVVLIFQAVRSPGNRTFARVHHRKAGSAA